MKPILDGECSALVYRDKDIGTNCQNPPRVEYNGKLYCTLHDPTRVKARSDERLRKWNEDIEKAREKRSHSIYSDILCRDVDSEEMKREIDEFQKIFDQFKGG